MKKLLLSIITVTAFSFGANATVLYVNTNATGANNGTSWVDAYSNLSTALAATPAGDSVFVAEGTYYPPSGGSFNFPNNLRIFGGFPNTGNPTFNDRDWKLYPTICDGDINGDDTGVFGNHSDNAKRIFVVDTYAIIDGFYIQNGGNDTGGYGCGLTINGSSSRRATIRNCVFKHNISSLNGGALNEGGAIRHSPLNATDTLTISNVTFIDNVAGTGGALIFGAVCIADNCKFINNSSAKGYAIFARGLNSSNHTNTNSYFTNIFFYQNEYRSGGVSFTQGGTINRYNTHQGDLVFTNCTFKDNDLTSGYNSIYLSNLDASQQNQSLTLITAY